MSKRREKRAARQAAAIVEAQNGQPKAALVNSPDSDVDPIPEKPPASNVIPIRADSTGAANRSLLPKHLEKIIRRRAYELYEMRGREDGHAEEDWLSAEREILGTVLRYGRTG